MPEEGLYSGGELLIGYVFLLKGSLVFEGNHTTLLARFGIYLH